MAALATEKRVTLAAADLLLDHLIEAAEVIYQGALVGDNGSGYAQAFVTGNPLLGVAVQRTVDNSGGAAGAASCRVAATGLIRNVAVTGASDQDDIGEAVYCATDNIGDFTLTATGATQIGKIAAYRPDTGKFDVYFEATAFRSI